MFNNNNTLDTLTATSEREAICIDCGNLAIHRTFSNCFGQEIGEASDCCRKFYEYGDDQDEDDQDEMTSYYQTA